MADAGLVKEYKKLAIRANARLKRIETDYSKREGYKGIKSWAYNSARRDIEDFGMPVYESQTRFSLTTKGLTDRQITARISAVNRFLESPTSTIGGINKMFDQRTRTINEKYGTNFTWEELSRYFEYGRDYLETNYAYNEEVFQVAGTVKDATTPEEILEAIRNNPMIADEEVALEIVKMLDKNGITMDDLF